MGIRHFMNSGNTPDCGAFKGRPGIGTRFVVRRNVETMLNTILSDILASTLSWEIRWGYLRQLQTFILCCEDGIAGHAGRVLQVLNKHADDDDKPVQEVCGKIAFALGFYVPCDILVPLFIEELQYKESEKGPQRQSVKTMLRVAHVALSAARKEELTPHLKPLISVLTTPEFEADASVLSAPLLQLAHSLVQVVQEGCRDHRTQLFNAVLNISALSGSQSLQVSLEGGLLQEYGRGVLSELATFCGLKHVVELFSIELAAAIKDLQNDYKDWNKRSPHRHTFALLLTHAREAVRRVVGL